MRSPDNGGEGGWGSGVDSERGCARKRRKGTRRGRGKLEGETPKADTHKRIMTGNKMRLIKDEHKRFFFFLFKREFPTARKSKDDEGTTSLHQMSPISHSDVAVFASKCPNRIPVVTSRGLSRPQAS